MRHSDRISPPPAPAEELRAACVSIASSQGPRHLLLLHAPLRGGGGGGVAGGTPGCVAHTPGGAAALARAVASHLADNGCLASLELGFSLPQASLRRLFGSLALAPSLRSVTLSGAPLGDAGLARLAEGLARCPGVGALRVAGCRLTDAGGATLAALVREHAHCAAQQGWISALRGGGSGREGDYGGDGRPGWRGSAASAPPPSQPPRPAWGLCLLDASRNRLGLATAVALCAALEPGLHATRLGTLLLVGCAMPPEAGDWLADVVRRGASLATCDLRGNGDRRGVGGCESSLVCERQPRVRPPIF